jgi:hypothetical protein
MDNCNFYTQTEVDSMSDDFDYNAIRVVFFRAHTPTEKSHGMKNLELSYRSSNLRVFISVIL